MKRTSNLAKHSLFLLHIKKEPEMIKNFKIRLICLEAIQQTLWVQKTHVLWKQPHNEFD